MDEQFLYESLIPFIVISTIAFLCAEFIGRGKHIGRGFSFFMMLGLIPGIIGLLFSPSAKKEPTKANSIYSVLGIFMLIVGLFGFYNSINNLTFVNFFALLSFLATAFYCFELSKGNVVNKQPKYYFQNMQEREIIETKTKLDSTIDNLKDLKQKGILTEEEYLQKVGKLEAEKTEQDLKNSTEYKQLKSLLDSGVLTKDEFESKVKLLNSSKNEINIQEIDKILKSANSEYFNNISLEVEKNTNQEETTDSNIFYNVTKLILIIALSVMVISALISLVQ